MNNTWELVGTSSNREYVQLGVYKELLIIATNTDGYGNTRLVQILIPTFYLGTGYGYFVGGGYGTASNNIMVTVRINNINAVLWEFYVCGIDYVSTSLATIYGRK